MAQAAALPQLTPCAGGRGALAHSFIFPSRRPIDTIQQKGEGAAGQPYPKNPPAAGLWAPAAAHCAGGGSLSGAELDRLLMLLRELEGRWVAEGACLGPRGRVGEPPRASFLGLCALLLPQLGTAHSLLAGSSARAAGACARVRRALLRWQRGCPWASGMTGTLCWRCRAQEQEGPAAALQPATPAGVDHANH